MYKIANVIKCRNTYHLHNYKPVPVALGDVSLVPVAITVTLNDVDSDSPVSTNVTVNIPSDSIAEYLDPLNPTQVTKFKVL